MAQCHAIYPGVFRDGAVSAPLFWLLCRRMRPVLSLWQVEGAHATAAGAALALSGESARPLLSKLTREAFPDG